MTGVHVEVCRGLVAYGLKLVAERLPGLAGRTRDTDGSLIDEVDRADEEFEAFLLPHLSMPKRGPKCKLGYYRVFNLILRVLYTGMQWKCLPVPKDANGTPAIHYTTVYKVFLRRNN